jgi:predicted phosphodiesterase
MNIAILADIHGNYAALQAVAADIIAWAPDIVVVAGDIVNRGPDSRACLAEVLRLRNAHGWRVLRGNHEGYVLRYHHERHRIPASGPRYEMNRLIAWTYDQVAHALPELEALPEHLRLDTPNGQVAIYHASIRHDRDGVLRHSSDAELRTQIDPGAAVFAVGHTHMPFVRRVDHTLLVNTGAVGLSFDGDPRAAYARVTHSWAGWHAEIRRVPYDVGITAHNFHASGMYAAVGAQAAIMLEELVSGTSLMFDFVPLYHDRLLSGAITLEEAVREFLDAYERAA